MPHHTIPETPQRTLARDLLRWTIIAAAAVALSHLIDRHAWEHWRDPRVNERDWGRLLRSMGYLPTWIIIAIGAWSTTSKGQRLRSYGTALVVAPAAAGIIAEVLKMLIRRLRPNPEQFEYTFRAFSENFTSTRGLGMPSSHVVVAFAGAAVLAHMFPRVRWLWYALAAGCATTRILALGHYLSDTVAAAAIGTIVAHLTVAKATATVTATPPQ